MTTADPWLRAGAATTPYGRVKEENSRLLREDVAGERRVFHGLPEVVMINHTDICNLRCVMCPRHLRPGSVRLGRDVLERIADALFPTARKVGLAAAQAEPTAVDFDFFVERALRYGVLLDVVTNGTLWSGDLYREARGALDLLDVSVDCHVPGIYEAIRLGARFGDLRRNLEAIRDVRMREPDEVVYTINAVVMRSNLYELPGLVRFAHEMGAHALVLKRLNHDVKQTPEEDPLVHVGLDGMRAVLAECSEVAREIGLNLVRAECGMSGYKLPLDEVILPNARFPRGAAMPGERLCWYLAQNFHVMQTGEVYPCIFPTPHSLGNVYDDDPRAIWNGEGFRKLRDAHYTQRGAVGCSGCSLAPYLDHTRSAAPPLGDAQSAIARA